MRARHTDALPHCEDAADPPTFLAVVASNLNPEVAMDPARLSLDSTAAQSATPTDTGDRELAAVRTLARWMDVLAIDPALGFLLPGVGDLVGSAFGLYVVGVAIRRRLPVIVIARMLLNLGLDTLIGAVPIAGDLADVAFRAHRRNAELLLTRHAARRASWRDWAAVLAAAGLLVGALAVAIWLTVAIFRAL